MTELPSLPPIYRPVVVPADREVRAAALDRAAAGAEPATLLWSERGERLDAAVILAPHLPLVTAAQVLFCGALGLGDAIASTIPPGVDVEFAWPGFVRVNARTAGAVTLHAPATAADAVPDWLVLAASVDMEGAPEGPPRGGAELTTLEFEACGDIAAADLVGAFALHLLPWINRWLDDGFAPIREAWSKRAHRNGPEASIEVGSALIEGRFAGLADDGAASIETPAGGRDIALLDVIAR